MKTVIINYLLITVLLLSAGLIHAQNTLQYSDSKIVTNTLETVPAGKVWKVTSVYGKDRICVPCYQNQHLTTSACNGTRYMDYNGAAFYVNGNEVFSEKKWLSPYATYFTVYSNNTCTTAYSTYSFSSAGWDMHDVEPNPNILPMWLSAGNTVQTASPKVFISVLEFNLVP